MDDPKYKVAFELGFPPHQISIALRSFRFKCAGDLVDYLNSQLYGDFYDDEEPPAARATAPTADQLCIQLRDTLKLSGGSKASSQVDDLSMKLKDDLCLEKQTDQTSLLLKETRALYASLHCIRCKIERRNVLTFPCCHITLCKFCSVAVRACPMKECGESIASTIDVHL